MSNQKVEIKESISINPQEIHLIKVNVFKTNILTSEEYLEKPIKVKDFSFGLSHESQYNLKASRINIRLYIELEGTNRKGDNIDLTGEYGIEFYFHIENIEKYIKEIKEEEKQASVEKILGMTLLSIAYSTARGIILERTQGTPFNGVILPVLDISNVLE